MKQLVSSQKLLLIVGLLCSTVEILKADPLWVSNETRGDVGIRIEKRDGSFKHDSVKPAWGIQFSSAYLKDIKGIAITSVATAPVPEPRAKSSLATPMLLD